MRQPVLGVLDLLALNVLGQQAANRRVPGAAVAAHDGSQRLQRAGWDTDIGLHELATARHNGIIGALRVCAPGSPG